MDELSSKPARARSSAAPLVVGIGASAGGLEAISALLHELPGNAPVGVVVLQQPDPAHRRSLPELLARQTSLEVVTATEGALVEAGQVHVIPPDADLRIVKGRLRLAPHRNGPRLPIDAFFDSLARDRGRRAAGVVLSGRGADGALGVCALRLVGATTFAQDQSALHRGMPEAAAASGCIDEVLAPAEIAQRLLAQVERAELDDRDDDDALQRVFAMLRRASGADFSSYKPSTLRRRIQRRAALGNHRSIETYLEALCADTVELGALAEDMLTHVTGFFRDAGRFAALSRHVLPGLLADQPQGGPFRVWVPNCGTGEELYSLAMATAELLPEGNRERQLEVFGTDLSEAALQTARAGLYPASIEGQVSAGRLQRFFTRVEGGYQLHQDLRARCVFTRQELTRAPPCSRVDLVSCRNVMIYLAAPVQRRAVSTFHDALRPGGAMLLGAAETPGNHPGFELLDARHRVYRRSAQPSRDGLVDGECPRWPTAPLVNPAVKDPAVKAPAREVPPEAAQLIEEGLRGELSSTRAYLKSVIEQLEAGNEELRASNEEVLSSNQRLLHTHEEMQTAREALLATNDAVVQRNLEAMRVNDDLTNVLNNVGMPVLILGPDARLRRFTPSAAGLFNLTAADVGRPISDIKSNLREPDLLELVNDVLEHLEPRERTVTDETGHWYQISVRPYLTTGHKVYGTVVTVIDAEVAQRSKSALTEALDYAEGIVDTVRDPLLVLDEHRKVRSANRSFYRKFQVSPEDLEDKPFEALGDPRWVPPVLISALDRLASQALTDDLRLEDTPARFAGRSMLVSGRPLLRAGQAPWVLLAFEDLTEQMRSDAAIRRSERALREMLGAASEAILIANGNGVITYANEMAARTFAYPLDDLTGLSIEQLVPEERTEGKDSRAFQASSGGEMVGSREVRGRRRDGTLFPAEVGLSVMEGEQGPLVVAFISDVTARHEAEARIITYKKNLQEMAFDAALVEDRQRRKLAMDLHDNIGQTLALAQIRLKAAQKAGQGEGSRDLAEGIKLIGVALADTRDLTFELSPPVLYDLGLPAAVSWLGEQLEAQHHLHVEVEADQPFEKVDDETAGLLFRAVRELLTNVVKHAQTSVAGVSIHREGSNLVVVVKDLGSGFDSERLENHKAAKGFGLFSVREQITRLGGTFEANSSPESGTCITLKVPRNDRRTIQPAVGEVK